MDNNWVFTDCLFDGLLQLRAERSSPGLNGDGSCFCWSVNGKSSSSGDFSVVANGDFSAEAAAQTSGVAEGGLVVGWDGEWWGGLGLDRRQTLAEAHGLIRYGEILWRWM